MKTKKSKTPEGIKCTKEFLFDLTDAEFKKKGQAAGALEKEVELLKTQKKEAADTWNAKINARAATLKDALEALDAGKEKRTVEAVLVKNYDVKEIAYWFEGKVVERRTMTETELQMEADFEKKQKNDRAKKQMLATEKKEKHDPVADAHKANGKDPEIAQVHKLETGRGTKHSSVDGPTRQ